MTKKEFLKLYEELKNKYEGQEEKALIIDNLIQSTFNTSYSMFDSSNLHNYNYTYFISVEGQEELEGLTVDYDITSAEGLESVECEIKINEIYLI